jgi:hypothetical protein
MALSNWDLIAFGPDGKPCNGVFESKKNPGDKLTIYKNWVYVGSKQMWRDKRQYVSPTIASFEEGKMSILKFSLEAIRGRQNAIFIFAKEFVYSNKKKGQKGYFESYYRRFAGIGCSGFSDRGAWVGVQRRTLKQFFTWLMDRDGSTKEDAREHRDWFNDLRKKNPEARRKTKKMTLKKSMEFCKDKEHRAWVAKCQKAAPLRFNQGDAFFAQHLKKGIPATTVGSATTPMLLKMIRGKGSKDNDNGKRQKNYCS